MNFSGWALVEGSKFFEDERGSLVVTELTFPFELQRLYTISTLNMDRSVIRGYHAHKSLKQIIRCSLGGVTFRLESPFKKEEITLQVNDGKILVIGCMVWRSLLVEPDSLISVCCNQPYEESDYLREYEAWRAEFDRIW